MLLEEREGAPDLFQASEKALGEGDTGAEFLRCDWEMREERKTGRGIPVKKASSLHVWENQEVR